MTLPAKPDRIGQRWQGRVAEGRLEIEITGFANWWKGGVWTFNGRDDRGIHHRGYVGEDQLLRQFRRI